MARILIYGTDELVTRKLAAVLQKEKFEAQVQDAFEPLPQPTAAPTLVVLDARLKWSLCRPLIADMQAAGYPVLFLTADREMTAHLRALYRGAADVLMLPFAPKLALAKVQGLLGHPEPLRELAND